MAITNYFISPRQNTVIAITDTPNEYYTGGFESYEIPDTDTDYLAWAESNTVYNFNDIGSNSPWEKMPDPTLEKKIELMFGVTIDELKGVLSTD